MAKAKVIHSEDAVQINFAGDKRNPEPSTGVIKFPGGFVEVSRCTDGTYWVHTCIAGDIIDGRIDRSGETQAVQTLPNFGSINHIAIRVSKKD